MGQSRLSDSIELPHPDALPDELLRQLLEDEEVADIAAAPGLAKLVKEQMTLQRQITSIEGDLAALKQRYDDIRKRQLPELMQSEGLVGPDGKGRFTHDTGARVHLTHKVRASYPKANEEDVFHYLRQNGHGALIKETVHPQTLSSFAKELMESGEVIPPWLSTHVETTAVITLPKQGEM